MRHPHAHREEYAAFAASQARANRKVARRVLAMTLRSHAEELDARAAAMEADILARDGYYPFRPQVEEFLDSVASGLGFKETDNG